MLIKILLLLLLLLLLLSNDVHFPIISTHKAVTQGIISAFLISTLFTLHYRSVCTVQRHFCPPYTQSTPTYTRVFCTALVTPIVFGAECNLRSSSFHNFCSTLSSKSLSLSLLGQNEDV